jgi:diphthine synthase
MVFFTPNWRPDSWYARLRDNAALGLHSLVLLDIKVKEPNLAALAATGRVAFEPPRFMRVAEAAQQMLEVEARRGEGVCGAARLAVGVARVGSVEQVVRVGTLEELARVDLGGPLQSLVLVGTGAHEMEREFLREFAVSGETFDRAWEEGGYGKS